MSTREKIEALVDELVALPPEGEIPASEKLLATQTTDVVYALASAALVDAARRRRRSLALTFERQAERPAQAEETPSGKPGRRGRRAYREWVDSTPEGRAYEAEQQEFDARQEADRVARLSGLLDSYKSHLLIEWTGELLSTEIAMPDGTRTTWGAASVDQHRERAAMFESMALGNIEGAARHLKAIDDLRRSGAPSLAAMVRAAAP